MKNFKLFEKCNRRIARRVTLIAVLLAMCMPQAWAGNNCGFWTSGSGEITFTANGVSKTMAFDNSTSDYTSIGTVTTLEISSFWIKTWKKHIKDGDFTGNVCQVEMYYAIHTSKNVWGDDSEKHKLIALHDGSYTDNYTDNWTTYNQQWKHISSTDVLDGLTPGTTYWIDFYFEIQGNNGSKDGCYGQQATLNNNKGNYHASFTYASEKTTFEPGQYVYLDARNQSWWKGADFDARFYFKRYDTSADIGDAVVCSHSNKLEDWVYYAIVPDNDYVGKLQVNRVNTSDADMSNYWWNNTTVKVASDRSNASQNCLNGTSSTSSDWDASWGTYCPPKATSVIEDNGTVTYGGDGGSSTPYLVEKGGTIKVQASSTNILEDGNMTTKYHFYDNTTSKSGEQSGSTYQFTASSSANITYQMRVNSYNQYNSTNSSDKYSDKKYYKTVICYTVTYNANGGTGSVPAVSGSKYMSGTNVTLATNTGSLAKSGYKLVGWNTADNGTGTHYDLGATLSSISANQTLYAEWLQIHTPSQFSYTSDYGKTPKLVSGYNYEWYSISKNGSGWFVLAGEQTASVSGGAANIAMTLPGTNTYKHQNWFTAKYEATNGSYAPGVAKTGVFEDVMSSGPCIRLKDSDEGLKMAVSGYSEFSFIATDNTADESKNKYIKVIIDGNDVTGSSVSASASIRSFAITSNYAHLIELRPAGGNGSSDFYCFALKLPDEVATYDITYECYSATSGCPSDADGQTALPDPLPSAPTKNGYDFDAWYTDNTFETEAVAGATLEGDVTLYAKWTCTTPTFDTDLSTSEIVKCKDATKPKLTVAASANSGSISYQWYSNTTNSTSDPTALTDSTKATMCPPTSAAGTLYYFCKATNTTGSCSEAVYSSITPVTVNKPTAITTQPSSIAKANVGEEQTLSLAAEGASLTYQWYSCDSNGDNEKELDGEDEATLSISPNSVGVTYYYCVVSGSCGSSQTSNVVSITAKNAISPTLTYASTVTYGSTVSPTLSGAGDGEVSYSLNSVTPASSLTIVSSTGVVSGAAAGGTATVTATIEDGTNYWGGSATSSTITVTTAALPGTASTGTATSVTHNSASLPFTITDITGVASITIKVYAGESVAKTYSGITPATSGSYSATGLSASTTYTYTVTLIGDANHNDKAETSKSTAFTTSAAPTLTAISANTLYQATNMLCAGMSPLGESDTYFTDDSYSTDYRFYYDVLAENGPKAHTVSSTTLGSGQPYEATFTSEIWVKGTSTVTDGIPSEPSIKFLTPSVDGTLYLYIESSSCPVKFKKADGSESNITGLTQVVSGKIYSATVVANSVYYIYGNGTKNTGFYGLKLVTCADPGLAFAADSKTTTLCDAAPTNALTNTHSVAVTYTSSDETVATVASDGTLTIKKAGTTTITASSLEQTVSAVTYCADNASYTLTVNASTAAGLAYGTSTVKKDVGDDAFTNTLTNSNSLSVTYSSSNEDVATIDSDGEVTIKAAGTTTITASSAQQKVSSTCYAAGSATYSLTVYPVYTVTYNAMGGTCATSRANTSLGKVTLPSASHDDYTTYTWVTYDGAFVGYEGEEYEPSGDITLYAKWQGDCAAGGGSDGVLFSAEFKDSGLGTENVCTAANDPVTFTTDQLKDEPKGGSISAYTTETLTHVKYVDNGVYLKGTDGVIKITLEAAINTNDLFEYVNVHSSNPYAYLRHTSASNSTDQIVLTGYNSKNVKVMLPAAFNGKKELYIVKQSTDFKLHKAAVVRPAFLMLLRDDTPTDNTNLSGTDEALTTENYLEVIRGGSASYTSPTSGDLIIKRSDNKNYVQFNKSAGYLKITVSQALQEGDVIGFDSYNTGELALTTTAEYSNTIHTTSQLYTVGSSSPLKDQTTFYIWQYSGSANYLRGLQIARSAVVGSSCYQVTYNGNGADGGYTNDPAQYAASGTVTVLANGFTKTGYAFAGWNTKADGSGATKQPGATFAITQDTTLHAQWKQIKYFTTEGNWNTSGNWSPSGVPEITDPVVIQENVTVDTDEAKALSVDIESGNTLTIGAGKALIIEKTLTKAGGATAAADVIINSTREEGTGALVMGSHDGSNAATVNFETKVRYDNGFVNQYLGSPFSDETPYVDYEIQLFKFVPAANGSHGWWNKLSYGNTMDPFMGYNQLSNNTSGNYLDLNGRTGHLNASTNVEFTIENGKMYYNSSWPENMFANSWTAPIHIDKFEDDDFVNVKKSIYIFNAGTPEQYAEGGSTMDGEANNEEAGTYSVIPVKSASELKDLGAVTTVIPAMQAFSVMATSSNPSLRLDFNRLVYTPALTDLKIEPTRAPRRAEAEKERPDAMRLRVRGENGWTANAYILGREDFTNGYDDGWDGEYMEGDGSAPQLYSVTNEGYFVVNCIPEIEGTLMAFHPGRADNTYTFSFVYNGNETWYLNDVKEQKSTLISNETTYPFVSNAGDNAARFVISKIPYTTTEITTGVTNLDDETLDVQKVIYNDKLYIIRGGKVFSADGQLVK